MPPADLALTGGVIYTVDAARRFAQALAVRGGRLVAVGSDADIEPLVGPRTRVLRLEGRMVLPGFQDAHVHPALGGLLEMRCDLHGASSRQACIELVARYASAHPDVEWITGGGWSIDDFPRGLPERGDLDAVVSERPVFLANRDGHGAWVNSRALQLAGITRTTSDPRGGRIERDELGEPSGTLHEHAMELVRPLLPATTPTEWEAAILLAQAHLHRLGITAWQDACIREETLAAYRALAERGELTARVEGNLLWRDDRGEEQLDDLLAQRELGTLGRLRIRGAKLFLDGVIENFTAALLEPYLDASGRPTDNRGLRLFEPEDLRRYVTLLDSRGFQVHVHAIGDAAVRGALDAFEAAGKQNGFGDTRHHIAHIQLVHPDDRQRFAELGVVANAQPLWACQSTIIRDLTIPFIGPQRAGWLYPFGSLHRAGAVLAFGSDWTVSTADPLYQIEVAVTRTAPGGDYGDPLLPHERIDLPAALAAFTVGAAYANFLEHETGTIEAGKLADLVVLDQNLFSPGVRPSEARVLLTLLEGAIVYDSAELDWS